MFARIDQDLALRHEAIMLGRETRSAEASQGLRGRDRLRSVLRAASHHLPARAAEVSTRPVAPSFLGRAACSTTNVRSRPRASDGTEHELRGQAFCELLEHLPTDGHGAANGVTMLVTAQLQRLLDGLGSARLDTGVHISAGEARRLSCNAGLVPVVLDGPSRVLDLGHTRRLATDGQRKALSAIHETCGIDGCDRPFAWCEIHHLVPWAKGGRTDLADLIPLCGHHHRRAHDDRFDLRRGAGSGWRFHPRR